MKKLLVPAGIAVLVIFAIIATWLIARGDVPWLTGEPTPPPHAQLPRMQLEAQYGGPLQDTIIQRWRDLVDGTVCYIYLPIAVHHTPPTATGFVEYGSNTIGSISCMPGAVRKQQ